MPKLPQYRRPLAGTQPEYLSPAYESTRIRSPSQPLIILPQTLSELTGPVFGHGHVKVGDSDLTRQHAGAPQGERMVLGGRVLDDGGRPVANTIIELWQCNAAGRYQHKKDLHDAPLDPNFSGAGRTMTDAHGNYQFITIKPGAYPWGNHFNAWRPAHIHLSLFGPAFVTRLVTQLYFPGDPLLAFDPIFNSTADEKARQRLVATFDWERTVPGTALGYRFDIILRGRDATPMEN
ncbi:MAG: protocatechuate 3,4-dioxygenase subunit beta [Herminiimonas sp.]|nr:protocatechuate 3,4-dioxygenase subunit beta [Herminiimonas sp.]